MHHWKKKWMVLIVVGVFVLTPGLSGATQGTDWAKEPTATAMIADFVFVRPLGIVATVLGSAFFIVTLPFSAPGGNAKAAYEKLMKEPAKFTFARPLGVVE
jgi:hypothetical protein